jgi:hypothetical protein
MDSPTARFLNREDVVTAGAASNIPIALGTYYAAGKAKTSKGKRRALTTGQVLSALSTLPHVPTWVEEARASKRALQYGHRYGGMRGAAGMIPELGLAFGSYAGRALPAAVNIALMQAHKRRIDEENTKKEASMEKKALKKELEIAARAAHKLTEEPSWQPHFLKGRTLIPGAAQATRHAAKKLEHLSKTAPESLKKKLLHEPGMQPAFLKGRHIAPKHLVERAAHAVSHEPVLGSVIAIPTTPAGPMAYLAARGAIGKALGVEGAHLPQLKKASAMEVVRKIEHSPLMRRFLSKEKRKALDNVDMHHGDDSKDKWDRFLERSDRKSFVKAMQNDPRTDDKLSRHVDQMNRLRSGKPVGQVGQYAIIRKRGGGLGCTCPDWRYKRSVAPDGEQDCKHIKEHRKMDKTAHVLAVYGQTLEKIALDLKGVGDILSGDRLFDARLKHTGAKWDHGIAKMDLEMIGNRTHRGVNVGKGSAAYKRQQRVVDQAAQAVEDAQRNVHHEGLKAVGAHATWAVPTALAARHVYKKHRARQREKNASSPMMYLRRAGKGDEDGDLTPRQARILGAFAGGVGGAKGGGPVGIIPGAVTGGVLAHPTHHAVKKLKGDYQVLQGPIAGLVTGTAGDRVGKLSHKAYEEWKKRR